MRAWRLAKRQHATLDGEGARRFGGRWSSPGVACVYASTHLSLALLEVLVHLDLDAASIPDDYVTIEIDVPDSLATETIAPERLRAEGPRPIGDEWLRSRRTPVLRVPSFVVAVEYNVLFNPQHPDHVRIAVAGLRPFAFDTRLFPGSTEGV